VTIDDLADVRPTVPEVDLIVDEAASLLPALQETRHPRLCGVRPLAAAGRSRWRGVAAALRS
jgi:hypothetical protein